MTYVTRDEILGGTRDAELGAYLIIASYNRRKWRELNSGVEPLVPPPPADRQGLAHETAQKVFPQWVVTKSSAQPIPEDEIAMPALEPVPIPGVAGVLLMRSFHTGMFADLKSAIRQHFDEAADNQTTKEELNGVVESIFGRWGLRDGASMWTAEHGRQVAGEKDPGIGWVAIVDRAYFEQFVERMGGRSGPLWSMYDIAVIPLNGDRTTKDVYEFMTPVNWRK